MTAPARGTAQRRRWHPSPETLVAVQDYCLLRTDRNGWIVLTTDGEQMWVEVEKAGWRAGP